MNFTDGNITNLTKSIEESCLKVLEKNGLISSFKKVNGLSGVKYEIFLPDKKGGGIEGPEKNN
jgi:hypothetical protein